METYLEEGFARTPEGQEAEAILRACVHCGFCTATCPTYQTLFEENDGPRGRIYLMKEVMEGKPATRDHQLHLDRCLTCRSCESTCPSGVKYGRLVDIGRELVDRQVERPPVERMKRWAVREGVMNRSLFEPALRLGRAVNKAVPGMLPPIIKGKLGAMHEPGTWPAAKHDRKVILIRGCVQPGMMPGIDAATARITERLGVESVVAPGSGCCGSVRHHLDDQAGALGDARRNIAAWIPLLEQGVETILVNASGCGVMVKDYGHLLRNDPAWAERAARVSAAARDLAEWLPDQVPALLDAGIAARPGTDRAPTRVAFHSPCTLQHGQQIRGAVETVLRAAGAELVSVRDSHLCCGSAGTYSLLQPELSVQLRDRKLAALQEEAPQMILSANVGCLSQLESGTGTPVRHWIEWLDARLQA